MISLIERECHKLKKKQTHRLVPFDQLPRLLGVVGEQHLAFPVDRVARVLFLFLLFSLFVC